MPRRIVLCLLRLALLACPGVPGLWAQDFGNLQIHGFATQGFLYSSNNNYLTMKSSAGSLQWTEGAVSLTDSVTDNLRVGMQFHMFQMGQVGGPTLEVDWASGDYQVDDHLGFRAGKVKIPVGLFNESQVVDSLFLWILLPQSLYPTDNRDFDLGVLGGEVYGSLDLGKRAGRVQYTGYVGEDSLDANGGYVELLQGYGLTFPSPPSGRAFGGDVRWTGRGLTLGTSALCQNLDGTGPQGSIHLPAALNLSYYAEWKKGRWDLVGEYLRTPDRPVLMIGSAVFPLAFDQRGWYPMVTYRISQKLRVGSYYSHSVDKAADTSLPANYSKDWTISGRYDFNAYFYGKVEGHFLHGDGLGYYASANPNGLKPDSKMLAARIGFAF